MYGFVNSAVENLIRRRFGDDKWEEICEQAGVSLGDSHSFQVHHVYEDSDIHSLLQAASDILGFNLATILEMFGEQFLIWCQEYGHSKTLQLLGRSLQDFLTNLDSLHDHLSSIYPHMEAPSFRCSPGRSPKEFFLHYRSHREGFEHLAVGIVKAVAREFYNIEVGMQLLVQKGEEGSDHSVFAVQEVVHYEQNPMVEAMRCNTPKIFPNKQLVTSEIFCKSFPFHIIFDRSLNILQCGATLAVLLSSAIQKDASLTSHFSLDHPLMNFTFDDIISHINTVFILRVSTQYSSCVQNDQATAACKSAHLRGADPLCLRGQMIYLHESDAILFLCSPRVKQMLDLKKAGLYISDIPLHDATRGLLMVGQAAESEFVNSVHLEELIVKLQSVQKSLEEEKQRMAGLLREMLPITVADSLMAGRMVDAERFECVTILFSDIVGFTSICSKSEPMQIVNMLNGLYSCFDQCVGQNQVYKVETIGDAYMVVGGLPQRNTTHAECVANQALDMMYYCRRICRPDNGNPITMRIGIHSGEVVAGIVGLRMPRYCLFGNTVNVASRAEGNGVPGRIQVTEYTYNMLKHNTQLSFTYRGPMEFKNVPEPIPCYFLLENSAKSKPTPVTFSEDLVPGYDLCTRPTPFASSLSPYHPPPLSTSTKYSSLLTVPSLEQEEIEAPPNSSFPHRPLSCSSASSSSTLQSRDETSAMTLVIPDISLPDNLIPQVLVPDISVTSASSSPSPVQTATREDSAERVKEAAGILKKQSTSHEPPRRERESNLETETDDESSTPESPFMFVPQCRVVEAPEASSAGKGEKLSLSCKSDLSLSNILGNFPFNGLERSGWSESVSWGRVGREKKTQHKYDSVSSMSPLREDATEDSLYSSFEGSETSDQERDDRRQSNGERERLERGRDGRRRGETVQPRLRAARGGLNVTVCRAELGDGRHSDGADDAAESVPVRKISDCSSRSVDSGTKMSEISKDEEECQVKLSDLGEASQDNSEMEEEGGRETLGERAQIGETREEISEMSNLLSPSLAPGRNKQLPPTVQRKSEESTSLSPPPARGRSEQSTSLSPPPARGRSEQSTSLSPPPARGRSEESTSLSPPPARGRSEESTSLSTPPARGRSEESTSLSPPPARGRSGSVHNKIEFFNKWTVSQQAALSSSIVGRKYPTLPRTRSEVIFSDNFLVPLVSSARPRRGSLLPSQEAQFTAFEVVRTVVS